MMRIHFKFLTSSTSSGPGVLYEQKEMHQGKDRSAIVLDLWRAINSKSPIHSADYNYKRYVHILKLTLTFQKYRYLVLYQKTYVLVC